MTLLKLVQAAADKGDNWCWSCEPCMSMSCGLCCPTGHYLGKRAGVDVAFTLCGFSCAAVMQGKFFKGLASSGAWWVLSWC